MTDLPEPRHLLPAAIAAGVAIVVRISLADKPRPWGVVALDCIATACLAPIVYYGSVGLPGALGGPLTPEFAGAVSSVAAILGWSVVVRVLRRFLGVGQD
jgi:hypothetical protein